MQENPSQEDLIHRILDNYTNFIEPHVGRNTTLADNLIAGLEGVLNKELGILPYDPNKVGPVLADGKRYTTAEILEMAPHKFIELHKSTIIEGSNTPYGYVTRYFYRASSIMTN